MRTILLVSVMALFLLSCIPPQPAKYHLGQMSVEEINDLALKLWKNGKYTDPELALEYADAAIAKDPEYSRAYFTKGFAYYNLQDYESSIENFSKAISLDPKIQESYNGRGWVYLETKQYQKAIDDFTKAIEIDSNYMKAFNNRGYTYLQINENEMACLDFKKVCDLGDCGNIKHAKKIGKCK